MTALDFIPPDLTVLSATGLVLLSFLTSAITASLGLGGGLILLVALASFLPPLVVIPIHAVVQLGSNFGRQSAAPTYQLVDHRIFPSRLNIWRHPLVYLCGADVCGPYSDYLCCIRLDASFSLNIPLRGFPAWVPRRALLVFVGGTGPLVSVSFTENMSRKLG